MQKTLWKKLAALCIAMSLLVISASQVFAASKLQLYLRASSTVVQKKQNFIISFGAANSGDIAALHIELLYDSAAFTIVQTEIKNEQFSDMIVDTNTAGKVIMIWDNKENVAFSGDMLTVEYNVNLSATASDKAFSLTVKDLFDDTFKYLEYSAGTATVTILDEISSAAKAVIEKIDAIGTVTSSADCLLKINDALAAFNKLTAAEKQQVNNYAVLSDAQYQYQLLKEQEDAKEAQEQYKAAVEAFRSKPIFSKTVDTVAAGDLTEILAAQAEYKEMEAYLRKLLLPEKELLDTLKEKASALQAEQTAKENASTNAAAFRANFASLLDTPVTAVILDDSFKGQLDVALDTLEMLDEPTQALLTEEETHLNAMLKRYVELQKQAEPESAELIEAANAFQTKYRSILIKDASDLTEEDELLIEEAIAEYRSFGYELRGKLLNEFETLNNLLFESATQDIVTDSEGTIIEVVEKEVINEVVKEVEKVVTKEVNKVKYPTTEIQTSNGMHKTIIILYALLLVSLLIFSVPTVTYVLLNKKYKKGEYADEQEYI
ncbi:MAG: hypothetical protein II317_02335 [Clostridia bacterium]|nr:hypothetical protein [Clostridia bacterium]